jgi:hypothetical protein
LLVVQVAVIITPHQVRKGNRGLVMVGGNMELGDVAGAATGASQLGDLMQPQKQAGGGEGQLLESVLKEELRFEADELSRAHGGAGATGRTDKPIAGQVCVDGGSSSSSSSRKGGGGGAGWWCW